MDVQTIINALRCNATEWNKDFDPPCGACPYGITEFWHGEALSSCDGDRICLDAADMLEQLTTKPQQR